MMAIYARGSVLPFRTDLDPEDYLEFIDPLMAQINAGATIGTVGYIVLLRSATSALFHIGFEYEARAFALALQEEISAAELIAANN